MRIIFFIIQLIIFTTCHSQDDKERFVRTTKFCLKGGLSFNFPNKQLNENLNEGYATEQFHLQNKTHVNPYATFGVDYHFIKNMAIQFNGGFNQTQNIFTYTTTTNSTTKNLATKFLHNNIFAEVIPALAFNRTRLLMGYCFYMTSPSFMISDNTSNFNSSPKVKLNKSFHFYTQIGLMHGVKINMGEVLFSASYYGLLNQYDSGINLSLGFSPQ